MDDDEGHFRGNLQLVRGDQYARRPGAGGVGRKGRGMALVSPAQRKVDQAFSGIVAGWIGPDGAVKSKKLYAVRERGQFPTRSVVRTVEAARSRKVAESLVREGLEALVRDIIREVYGKAPPPSAPAARIRRAA